MTQEPKLLNDPAEGALQLVCALFAAGQIKTSEKAIAAHRALTVALSGAEDIPKTNGIKVGDEAAGAFGQ